MDPAAVEQFLEALPAAGLVQHLDAGAGVGTVHFDVSFWLMLPIAAVVAAFFGLLFGVPPIRPHSGNFRSSPSQPTQRGE
jgi:ABC-type branched-subunit amino acid transport system permease subunit